MMANQLALLDLSTLHRDPDAPKPKNPREHAHHKSFPQCWIAARRARALREAKSSGSDEKKPLKSGRRIQRPERHSLLAARTAESQAPQAGLGRGRGDQRLYVEQRIQYSGPDLGPRERPTGYFVNPTVMDNADLRDGQRRPAPMSAAGFALTAIFQSMRDLHISSA